MTPDESLNLAEEALRKLKIQYDLFFLGVRKLPPTEDRKRLDNTFRELSAGRNRDNGARFRLNTLLGRFNQFQELWTRQMREREEGPSDHKRRIAALRGDQDVRAAAASARASEETVPRVTSSQADSYVTVTDRAEGNAMEQLFQQVAEAQKQLGKSAGMSLEQLASSVRKQAESLRLRYGVSNIGFRVETVDGKVKLKAKPLQDS